MANPQELFLKGDGALNKVQSGFVSTDQEKIADFISKIFVYISDQAVGIVGSVCALSLVYLAFSLIMSGGDEDKVSKIKTSMLYVCIGFCVVIFSVIIINISASLPGQLLEVKK